MKKWNVTISYGEKWGDIEIQAENRLDAIKYVADLCVVRNSDLLLKSIYIYGDQIDVDMSENSDDYDKDF